MNRATPTTKNRRKHGIEWIMHYAYVLFLCTKFMYNNPEVERSVRSKVDPEKFPPFRFVLFHNTGTTSLTFVLCKMGIKISYSDILLVAWINCVMATWLTVRLAMYFAECVKVTHAGEISNEESGHQTRKKKRTNIIYPTMIQCQPAPISPIFQSK